MKRYILLSLGALLFSSVAINAVDKKTATGSETKKAQKSDRQLLKESIERSDEDDVKKYIRRIEQMGPRMDLNERLEYIEFAEEIIKEKKDIGIFTSPWDTLNFFGGGSTWMIAGVALLLSVGINDPKNAVEEVLKNPLFRVAMAFPLYYGIKWGFKGMYCDTAYGYLAKARKVLDAVEKIALIEKKVEQPAAPVPAQPVSA